MFKYNTIQYNTIQYNTIQYNTIQYSTVEIQDIKQLLNSVFVIRIIKVEVSVFSEAEGETDNTYCTETLIIGVVTKTELIYRVLLNLIPALTNQQKFTVSYY
jgi:hypothetical protein